jgi:hypothetical protein
MEVDEWEIAVMHRSAHGGCCRVSRMQGDLNAVKETLRVRAVPALEQMQGFCRASLLLNRESGLACVTTCLESRAAMGRQQYGGRGAPQANRLRRGW